MRIIGGTYLPGSNRALQLPFSTHRKLQVAGCLEESEGWLIRIGQVNTTAQIVLKDISAGVVFLTNRNSANEQQTKELNHQLKLCIIFVAACADHQHEQITELEDEIIELEDESSEAKDQTSKYVNDIPF